MRVLYILLNICLPYYNSIILTCIETSGSISIFSSTILLSSPTNLVCGFISRYYILYTSYFGVGKASTFSYYWIFYGYFFS
jgi:hypothetical protein